MGQWERPGCAGGGVAAGSYLLGLALWLVVSGTIGILLATMQIGEARDGFDAYVDAVFHQLETRLQANEAVLQGMVAFLQVAGTADRGRAHAYVETVLGCYRHIHQIGLVERVSRERLPRLYESMREAGLPDFRIRYLEDSPESTPRPLPEQAYYYPITFVAPADAGTERFLGLDVSSMERLQQTVERALAERRITASPPLRLIRDEWAYVLYAPVTGRPSPVSDRMLVSMIIRARDLLPADALILPPATRLVVRHPGLPNGVPDRILDNGPIPDHAGRTGVFGALSDSRTLSSTVQPFVLEVEQALGWRAFDFHVLAIYVTGALLALIPVVAWCRGRVRRREEAARAQDQLYRLANYDSLTGLPNRNLFRDRIEHALERARRSGQRMALLYLDLDGFKAVNDTVGHAAGDHVLREVARRLLGQVRAEDTIARLSGDELCVVVEDVGQRVTAERIAGKLRGAFIQPFEVAGYRFLLGCSIGVALFPEDGDDVDTLLQVADTGMYAEKYGER